MKPLLTPQPSTLARSEVPADLRLLWHTAITGCFIASVLPLSYGIGRVLVHTIDFPLALLVFLSATLPRGMAARGQTDPLGRRIDLGMLAYALLFVISAAYSLHVLNSLNASLNLARYALAYVAFRRFFAAGLFRLSPFTWLASCLWAIEIAVGLLQYVTQSTVGVVSTYFGDTSDPGGWFEFDEEISYATVYRISGTHYVAPDYACWLVFFSLVMTVGIGLSCSPLVVRALLLCGVHVLTLTLILLSLTRGVVAFYLLAIAILLVLWARKRPAAALLTACLAGFVLLSLATFVPSLDVERLVSGITIFKRGFEDEQRGLFLEIALQLLDHPRTWLVGVGPDAIFPAAAAFGIDLSQLSVKLGSSVVDFANLDSGVHNFFADTAVENGVLAGLCVAFTFLAITYKAWRDYFRATGGRERVVCSMLVAFWTSTYVPLATQHDYISPFGGLFVMFLLAWLQYAVPVQVKRQAGATHALAIQRRRQQPPQGALGDRIEQSAKDSKQTLPSLVIRPNPSGSGGTKCGDGCGLTV